MKKLFPLLCFLIAGLVYIGCSEEFGTQATPDQETAIIDSGLESLGDELSDGTAAKRCTPWPQCKGGGGSSETMDVTASGAIAYQEHSFDVSKNTTGELTLQVSQPASFTNFSTNFSLTLAGLRSGAELTPQDIADAITRGDCAVSRGRGGVGTNEKIAAMAELSLGYNGQVNTPIVSSAVKLDKLNSVSADHLINVQFNPDGNGTIIVGVREVDNLLPGVYPTAVEDPLNTITYSGGAVHVWSRQGKVKDHFSFACINSDEITVLLLANQ